MKSALETIIDAEVFDPEAWDLARAESRAAADLEATLAAWLDDVQKQLSLAANRRLEWEATMAAPPGAASVHDHVWFI